MSNPKPEVKKSAETKKINPKMTEAQFLASKLDLPVDLAERIASEGLVARWINGVAFQREQGFHKSRWQPYKLEQSTQPKGAAFRADPEGYVRRGDLILAVRTEFDAAQHKAVIARKNDLHKSVNAQKRAEFAQQLREHGVKSKVVEGYDDDGSSNE